MNKNIPIGVQLLWGILLLIASKMLMNNFNCVSRYAYLL
nr:MAG TPA: hypothetical protein [Caudoviricetes sp.]